MLLARVLFIKMRHEPYLADPVLGAYRRGGVEIVVDHEPLPAAVLAFDGAPDAHMAEPGIALFRGRLPGPEQQPHLARDPQAARPAGREGVWWEVEYRGGAAA